MNSLIKGLNFDEGALLLLNIGKGSYKTVTVSHCANLVKKVHAKDPKFASILSKEPLRDRISLDILKIFKNISDLPEEISLSIEWRRRGGSIGLWEAGRQYPRFKKDSQKINLWKLHLEYNLNRPELIIVIGLFLKDDSLTVDDVIKELDFLSENVEPLFSLFKGTVFDIDKLMRDDKTIDQEPLNNFLLHNKYISNVDEVIATTGMKSYVIRGKRRAMSKINANFKKIDSEFSEYLNQGMFENW